MKLDPFYLIVDDVRWIKSLVPLGVKLVQLRIKNTDLAIVREQIRKAKKLCTQYACQLVINDYWQLALEEACEFIHLGQEDLQKADKKAIDKAKIKIGISTHDQHELEEALKWQPTYIALGPIYPTTLKKMKWAPQGLEKIAQWKERIGALPLVAIGGLNIERGLFALQAGAQSAAVVTDVLYNKAPEERAKAWLKATQRWR